MYLTLHILEKTKAVWLLTDQGKIKHQLEFPMEVGEENVLLNLDKFLHKCKINLPKVSGFGLIVKESSLTQVKVLTTIINTLGWNYSKPTVGIFYDQIENILEKLTKEIAKQKKFKQIKVVYQRKPEITISHKKSKFKIVK
jgi:hypothetical protein